MYKNSMSDLYVKQDDAWHPLRVPWVKDHQVWWPSHTVWRNVHGAWVPIWSKPSNVTYLPIKAIKQDVEVGYVRASAA